MSETSASDGSVLTRDQSVLKNYGRAKRKEKMATAIFLAETLLRIKVAQVLLPFFLSVPQGVSVPGLPGTQTTLAAQQSRLTD